MAFWLLKADPKDYGFLDLVQDGKTYWDGVTNNLALKHIRQVRKGDEALIYHSGKEKAIVGRADIVSNPYPDPCLSNDKLVVFDLKATEQLKRQVSLAEIKADKQFADFELVRMPRLSVMPVPPKLWNRLLKMAG